MPGWNPSDSRDARSSLRGTRSVSRVTPEIQRLRRALVERVW
jgi:hypothetical protein